MRISEGLAVFGRKRKPLITDAVYGKLMTSFGRVVDLDAFIAGPAAALAEKVAAEHAALVAALDEESYEGSTAYHLRLLGGAWLLSREGRIPVATAEAFEEAVVWRFGHLAKGSGVLPHRLSELARGEAQRDLRQ